MSIEYHAHPEQFTGKGTVWIAWDDDRQGYICDWDLAPDGRPTPLEEAAETSSLERLLEWGRERAPRVFVRPEHDAGQYYWAGEGSVPEDAAREGMKPLRLP